MPDSIDPIMAHLAITAALQLIMAPIVVFLLKRMLGGKLDSLAEKREEARREQLEREKSVEEWRNAVTGGLRSILRAELVNEHRKAIEQGYCDLETKEYIDRTYHAYHKLGGNGIGTRLHSEIEVLPSSPNHSD